MCENAMITLHALSCVYSAFTSTPCDFLSCSRASATEGRVVSSNNERQGCFSNESETQSSQVSSSSSELESSSSLRGSFEISSMVWAGSRKEDMADGL